MESLGHITIRIPIDHLLLFEFDADIIYHDIPIIAGSEHHMKKKCSTNEDH